MGLAGIKRWLFRGATSPSRPTIAVAAFGKHPGWDDHIDDLGLDNQRLAAVKRLLYVTGVGGNIDRGSWAELDESHRLAAFHHVFAWLVGDELVVGRLWSSRDGKGRSSYPMVVCIYGAGLPLHWLLERGLPALAQLEARCTQTNDPAEVRSAMDDARHRLRVQLAGTRPAPPFDPADAVTLADLADHSEMNEARGRLHRLAYVLDREIEAGGRAGKRTAESGGDARPATMRVPACGETERETLYQWVTLVAARLTPGRSVLAIYPLDGGGWVDVVTGEPTRAELFCLGAGAEALPVVTEIPYNLDAAFVQHVEDQLAATPPAPSGSTDASASWYRKLLTRGSQSSHAG